MTEPTARGPPLPPPGAGRVALASVADGILHVARDGTITYANPAATRLLGRAFEELMGQPEHGLLHAKSAEGVPVPLDRCAIHATLRDGAAHHSHGDAFWCADGRRLLVDLAAIPVPGEGAIVVFRPIASARDAAGGGIDRAVARRIFQDLLAEGPAAHQSLTAAGRSLARDTEATDIDGYAAAFEAMGLGRVRIDRVEGARYAFAGDDLIEHKSGSRTATCSFTLGYLSEGVSRVHGNDPTLGTEIECQSRGASECRFIVHVKKPEEGLARRVRELV